MKSRISDLRVLQAQQHGRIVGLPKTFAEEVAALADFLMDCHLWSDVTLPFEGEIVGCGPGRWRVPVAAGWWLMFDWVQRFGPVELQLWHEDDG
ncbi:hypothetical protein [Mesorhizobium sp.]|uniref:hypothetical protein n=1 Tax=Mesorhizobium sp. TaxID=1871066 RepID=UPI000FE40F74|nr:hypothetical protein [Mesorhizobium sp.]RWH69159.1 MAG: hypothetical protein EOQ84_23785 [Mesorhizobium sp.]RWL24471.1 MAG: hypothetical protein EOR63_30175 [Mesorhizobium sp.]RWL26932.1 MAG: hypothetical protein EOR58_16950 [Mesorhizobium sp.]RWL38057.1 MAG: hypothetical protein EOR59_15635 [Mesorhizobium sp.]RWL56841.1 MAG: hypothetical protein EOR62_05490 [Mesorhizobium sp.]